MKKFAGFAVSFAVAMGCLLAIQFAMTTYAKHHLPPSPLAQVAQVATQKLSDEEKISLLRAEANKRGLKWHVYCTQSDGQGFQAEAVQRGAEFTWYIERGGKGIWAEQGKTQADAAHRLYLSLRGGKEPYQPEHEERSLDRKHCPPELRGE